jgi:cyclophilin family peptidyl-prolyl cis-trans isomerase
VPSEKRARQRAARAEKHAQLQKNRKRRQYLRRGLSMAAVAAAVVLVVLLITLTGSSGKHAALKGHKKPTATTATTKPTSTPTGTFAPPTTQPLTAAAVVPTCPTPHETKRIVWFTKAPPNCIGSTSVWDATFDTSLGSFTVEMPAANSYAAVNNFVFLAQWNYYNGTFFHRVIPGFVVQGGDPTGTGTGGPHGFPGYSFTGNFPPESCTKTVTAPCYHTGDFVMANSNSNPQKQDASTDGSQFFIVLPGGAKTLNSEPTYTNFGKVTSGMSVVKKIGLLGTSGGTPTKKVYILKVTVNQVKS